MKGSANRPPQLNLVTNPLSENPTVYDTSPKSPVEPTEFEVCFPCHFALTTAFLKRGKMRLAFKKRLRGFEESFMRSEHLNAWSLLWYSFFHFSLLFFFFSFSVSPKYIIRIHDGPRAAGKMMSFFCFFFLA